MSRTKGAVLALAAIAAGVLWQRSLAPDALPDDDGCVDGVTCQPLQASGLTFDCRLAGPSGNSVNGSVVLLHGFPDSPAYFAPLMRRLGTLGYRSMACAQRGYSPGASPRDIQSYASRHLVADVLGTASAAGLARPFHVVGHDIGAVLAWILAARHPNEVRSVTAMAVPHLDAFNDGLYGPDADEGQVMANYDLASGLWPPPAALRPPPYADDR